MQSWLEGRIWVGKVHKQQGWLQAWEYSQEKLIQALVSASQGVDWSWSQASRVTTLRRLQEKGYQATSKPETTSEASYLGCGEKITQWSKVLFSDESKFCISFGNKVPESGGRVERHRIHVAWSPVWSFHSQWWFGLPCHLLVLVHCVFWSPQSTQPSTRKILEHFMLPSADKLYGDADFIFQQDLAPAHTAQRYQKLVQWPWCYCAWLASKIAWPEPHRESMGYCQEEDERHQTQQCRWPWRPLSKKPGLPYHLSSATKLITSMPRRIEAVIKAKGAPTKYWVHIRKLTYFPEGQQFTKKIFFIGLMKYSNLFEIVNGGFFVNVSLIITIKRTKD